VMRLPACLEAVLARATTTAARRGRLLPSLKGRRQGEIRGARRTEAHALSPGGWLPPPRLRQRHRRLHLQPTKTYP
jgi:hypothetical protein